MTRDELIAMVLKSGLGTNNNGIERFAALVAAAEREACAEMVAGMNVQHPKYIAAAIRERGEK